jgi:HAD superfamily hydrolase (TIGR01549 family)
MRPLIGFDMDGVILDSDTFTEGSWIVEAFRKTLRDLNIPETEENARALYVNNLRVNADAFCQRFGIRDPAVLWRRREENYITLKLAALETGEIALFPDVKTLEGLAKTYALGIVSNSPQIVVDRVVSRFLLDRIFGACIGRGSAFEDLPLTKPAPHLLERLKRELKTTQGYYVGDQPEDMEAARAASLRPIWIVRGGNGGDIADLSELKGFLERCKRISVVD